MFSLQIHCSPKKHNRKGFHYIHIYTVYKITSFLSVLIKYNFSFPLTSGYVIDSLLLVIKILASEKDEEGEHLIHGEVCDLCRPHGVVESGASGLLHSVSGLKFTDVFGKLDSYHTSTYIFIQTSCAMHSS